MLAQIVPNPFHLRRTGPRKDEGILCAAPRRRKDNKVLGKKFRLARDGHALKLDRLRDRFRSFTSDEGQFAWLFVGGDEGTEQIGWDSPAATARARHRPGDGFAKEVLFAENRRQFCRQVQGQCCFPMKGGWFVQLSPDQPELYLGSAQNFWSKIEERSERDQENGEGNDRMIMQQSESTDDKGVLADAERNVRKRFW